MYRPRPGSRCLYARTSISLCGRWHPAPGTQQGPVVYLNGYWVAGLARLGFQPRFSFQQTKTNPITRLRLSPSPYLRPRSRPFLAVGLFARLTEKQRFENVGEPGPADGGADRLIELPCLKIRQIHSSKNCRLQELTKELQIFSDVVEKLYEYFWLYLKQTLQISLQPHQCLLDE